MNNSFAHLHANLQENDDVVLEHQTVDYEMSCDLDEAAADFQHVHEDAVTQNESDIHRRPLHIEVFNY